MSELKIPDHLAHLAARFDIDLQAFAPGALYESLLRAPVDAFTPRMREILLSAQQEAEQRGHRHIGTEHVFLATLLDPQAIPTQVMRSLGSLDEAIRELRTFTPE